MKKFVKLSLAASLCVAGLTSANASTLAEAFAASKVKGEIKSQYFQKDEVTDGKSSIWTNGGNLSLTTGSYNGLVAGVTFQTAHVATIDDTAGNYNGDMDASGTVMSEAFLSYGVNNTSIKVGRQYITTPLVAGSGSRIFKQSFEGIVVANTDLPNTTLVAAYADKFQARTDGNGGEPTFDQYNDGAYTVYAKNKSVENLTLEAQYAVVRMLGAADDMNALYIQGAYKLDAAKVELQTYQTDNGAAANSTGTSYGVKVSGNVSGLDVAVAYSTNGNEANVVNGVGSGADKIFTASPINGGNYTADTDAYQLALGYKFNNGLGLNASYTNWETGSNPDSSETNLTASYKFDKNLSTKIMYSTYDNGSYDYRSRVYVSYKF